eukprot:gnl/Chilomastix_cuspidata/6019.p1 GENE.gnl/Chilomastix_cuspidata/6019~~gnl/Chilomastix_cuspidata/6019.p1  ORF type:complete len:298 (+),score=46.78 gnl/Chilomastix_cuspidata/6019:34-927(+)
MRTIVLGHSGDIPSASTINTTILIQLGPAEPSMLFDCGEGCFRMLDHYGVFLPSVEVVFISSLKNESSGGLVPFLHSFRTYHKKKRSPMTIVCPRGLKEYVESVRELTGGDEPLFPLTWIELSESARLTTEDFVGSSPPLINIAENGEIRAIRSLTANEFSFLVTAPPRYAAAAPPDVQPWDLVPKTFMYCPRPPFPFHEPLPCASLLALDVRRDLEAGTPTLLRKVFNAKVARKALLTGAPAASSQALGRPGLARTRIRPGFTREYACLAAAEDGARGRGLARWAYSAVPGGFANV